VRFRTCVVCCPRLSRPRRSSQMLRSSAPSGTRSDGSSSWPTLGRHQPRMTLSSGITPERSHLTSCCRLSESSSRLAVPQIDSQCTEQYASRRTASRPASGRRAARRRTAGPCRRLESWATPRALVTKAPAKRGTPRLEQTLDRGRLHAVSGWPRRTGQGNDHRRIPIALPPRARSQVLGQLHLWNDGR
jgi:hypothetical protein